MVSKHISIKINIRKEEDQTFRSSVNDDAPAAFNLPEPFWSDYIKNKKIKPHYLTSFGEAIFRSAFNTEARENQIRDVINALTTRSHLIISIGSSDEIIHELPWELIKDPQGNFLANRRNISICRTIPGPISSPSPTHPPYRILVIISLPVEAYEEAPLNPLRELQNLYQALDDFLSRGLIKIDVCVQATRSEILRRLIEVRYNVVHFIGHGGPGGVLVLEDEKDFLRSHQADANEVQGLFRNLAVQAVVLNACHTQSASAFEPSLAFYIYHSGVPVVIANQTSVNDDQAVEAAKDIYSYLFLPGQNPAGALDMARLKITDWWKPVIFVSPELKSGELFLPPAEEPSVIREKGILHGLGTLGTTRVYVYRYRPLREITQYFFSGEKAVVLHGLGGVGKSFMADYLARFLRPEFAHVIALNMNDFIGSGVRGVLEKILRQFEENKVISSGDASSIGKTRAISLSWRELNQALNYISWLLILDNFEHFQDRRGLVKDEEMKEFLRVLRGEDWRGRFLITSRLIPYLDQRSSLEPVVEIGTYDEAERLFLLSSLSEKEAKAILESQVVAGLGWHPLALNLFLQMPTTRVETILGRQEMREVFDDFYRDYVTENQKAFSRIFSLQYPFSLGLLEAVVGDPDLVELLFRRLRVFQVRGEMIQLYPIFIQAFQDQCPLSPEEHRRLTNTLAQTEAENIGDSLNRFKVLEEALSRKEIPNEKTNEFNSSLAEEANNIGGYFSNYGRIDEAIFFLERALEIRKKLSGEKHPDVATSYNNLGMAYKTKGDLGKAISYYVKALDTAKDLFGEKHLFIATSYNNLGCVYQEKGDLNNAISFHKKALGITKDLFGEKHSAVATSYNNLGIAYKTKGDLEKAISYYEKALEIVKDLFGQKHPHIAISYDNLGMAYHTKGDPDKAISYLEKALGIRKDLFEEKHPDIATSYNNLGMVYHVKGELDKATSYYEKALEIMKDLFGENHPNVATSYNNLGGAYQDNGDLDKAIFYYEKALGIAKDLFGENHPNVATSYNNLGGAFKDKQNLDKAITNYEKALGIWKNLFGEKHPNVATSYNNFGIVYQDKGDLDNAISYLEKALEIRKDLFGESHPAVATSYNNLGCAYQAKGELNKAIFYFEKALGTVKDIFGKNHPQVATFYFNLGTVYQVQGDLDKATSYYDKSLLIYGIIGFRLDEIKTCIVLVNLLLKQSRTDKAAERFCQALDILNFLWAGGEKPALVIQADQVLKLAGELEDELKKDKYYQCRNMIKQLQEELEPLLMILHEIPASPPEKDK
ncbi:MAG: tetratricopeptide repeat protein [bacterium]|nr:tetratricopeptide repeat protein [bacterium]